MRTPRAADRDSTGLWGMVLLGGLLVITSIAGEGCGDDTPRKRIGKVEHPVLKSRLAEADYQARRNAAAAQFAEAAGVAGTTRPPVGVIIKGVAEGSTADDLGLNPGDLAGKINGVPIWSASTFGRELRRSLEYFSVESQSLHTVDLPPGKIGVQTIEYWRPEWDYLRSKSAKPEWNEDAVLGILQAAIDPDLAETAWATAFRQGYKPDVFSAAAALQIALARNDAEQATACADYLGAMDDKAQQHVHPVVLYRAALAHHRLNEMLRIVRKYPGLVGVELDQIRELIDLQRQLPQAMTGRSLAEIAAGYQRADLLPRVTGHTDNDRSFSLPALRRNERLTMHADPGGWDGLFLSPVEATSSLDITFKVTWKPINAEDGQFHSNIEIALVDNSSPEFDFGDIGDQRPALLSYWMTQSSRATNESGGEGYETRARLQHYPSEAPFQFVEPGLKWGADAVNVVRILKVGNQADLFINGRRQISIPLDPELKQVGLRVANSASETVIDDFHFEELVEPAAN